jgi:hypothetical protein
MRVAKVGIVLLVISACGCGKMQLAQPGRTQEQIVFHGEGACPESL